MNDTQFDFFADYFHSGMGLVLTKGKTYLIEDRLLPIAKRHNIETLDAFIAALKSGADKDLIREVTDAMTINESYFFRDGRPFEQFETMLLPEIIENRKAKKRIRIWSAAASVGQEPYSLAMILKENALKLDGWSIEIIATDLSSAALAKARSGVYSDFEVKRGLPDHYREKYFVQKDSLWHVKPEIQSMVRYSEHNLMQSPAALGIFDIVFCRNVLIYFDTETKGKVLAHIRTVLADDGVVLLGGGETVIGITDKFAAALGQQGVYRVNGNAIAA